MSIIPWAAAGLLSITAVAEPAENGVNAEQFLRFVKSQQSLIHDAAFAFEGEQSLLGSDEEAGAPGIKFQGRYAWRSDGATYLERFLELGDSRRTEGLFRKSRQNDHIVQAMIGGRSELARITPGYLELPNPPVRKGSAGPGSFFNAQSPETFLFLWRFQELKGSTDFGYKFLGWEEIDGHRCAHVEFDPHPNSAGRVLQELWVDLERGAHPLRIKNSEGGQTIYLIDSIRLKEYKLPSGEAIWFPVSGRFQKYYHEGAYTQDPSERTTLYVLNGTLVFNQGLRDGVFHVKAERFRPAFTPPRTASDSEDLRPGPNLDFEGVEKKINAALANAARKAPPQDASRSTQNESGRVAILAWGFGLGGVAALLVGGFLALRHRAGS